MRAFPRVHGLAVRSRAWWLRQWQPREPTQPPGRIVDLFRRDRLLLAATVVMAAFAIAPLFFSTFLPLGDLPDTVSCAALIPEIIWGKGAPAQYYTVQWAPIPYWTTTVIVAVVASIANVLVAAKVVVGVIVLLLPLATMRMLMALRRDPRIGLLAFGLSWEHTLHAGWIAHGLGMGIATWALAWMIEAETIGAALRVAVLGGLLGLTHALPTLYFVTGTIVLVLARPGFVRRFVLHATAGAGLALSFVPWLVARARSTGDTVESAFKMTFEEHPLSDKLRDLFRFTLDNFTRPADVKASAWTFMMLLFSPLLLTLLPLRPRALRVAPLILFLVAAGLYVMLPMSVSGMASHWYTYPRFATLVLLSLLFLPRPDLSGWRGCWLLPGVAIVLAFHVRVASQFADWNTRTRPYLDLIQHVRRNARTLPLELDDTDPAVKWAIGNQMHAYIASLRSGFDPHMWNYPSYPFQYRQEKIPPSTGPTGAAGTAFKLEQFGPYYDYVLVQGKKLDPLPSQMESEHFRARLEYETDFYRLYEIQKR